ncbi:hypothetical protein C5E45_32160 [Nocardia nova]|uniref:Uncharacterized protein n=1 Tax=Nocardia nova TaxID=37330 RepID=A0A2S6AEB4_9NOCA|nr:hypothetical protein C5E45_32160 [Nocardia nova]
MGAAVIVGVVFHLHRQPLPQGERGQLGWHPGPHGEQSVTHQPHPLGDDMVRQPPDVRPRDTGLFREHPGGGLVANVSARQGQTCGVAALQGRADVGVHHPAQFERIGGFGHHQ